MPEFYVIFARKWPNFTRHLSEKYFFSEIGEGILRVGVANAPCPRLLRLCFLVSKATAETSDRR